MKKFILPLVIVVASGLSAFATEKTAFDELIKKADQFVTTCDDEKTYEKYEFRHKKSGEKKTFADFTKIEQAIYIVVQCERFAYNLASIFEKWEEELKNAEDTTADIKEASKKDIENYISLLLEIRKKNAVKLENLVDKLIKEHGDSFTDGEKENIVKSVKEFNDKYKLIKR